MVGFAPFAAVGAIPLTFLHASSQSIVNENKEKVMLRGVGLGNWMLPEGYMWKFGDEADRPRRIEKLVDDLIGPEQADRFWTEYRENYITEADIQRIADLGYNSVRPALNARLFLTETDPPRPVKEGFELLDNLVKWCKASGIYVIIDMHAAPGGQTGQNIDDSADDQPELFMQPKYQDRLVDLWAAIARRYKDEPAVAGYDLLNEPLPERTGAAAKFGRQLEPLYQRITRAIRAVDSRHMVILEGDNWANDWSVFTRPFDSNLVYQFHYYCWDSPAKLESIRQYLDFGRRYHVPIWVGETGESDAAIYWGTTDYFEANNIGWSFWPWKKMAAANAPYSINKPRHWAAVVAYSKGGAKPSREVAQAAFDELLANIRLTNCTFFPEIVNSMLHHVPVRIEAENYGHEGLNHSYLVNDAKAHSEFYRTDEPVRVEPTDPAQPQGGLCISLQKGEWTAYTINCDAQTNCSLTFRVRAVDGPAEAQLAIGSQSLNLKLVANNWTEIQPGSLPFHHGSNRLKWIIKQGTADLDWIEVKETAQNLVQPILSAKAADH